MGIWKSLAGTYTLEIISASPGDMLNAVNSHGINLFDVSYIDDLRVRGSIYKFDYNKLFDCLAKRGEECKVIERKGLYWSAINLRKRPVLLFGCLAFLFMVLYLPTRVLFVKVEGNINIPDRLIISEAEQCGIGFGASRRHVRSEKMKNALLSAIPQLQWAGVNTTGCVAIISVKERSETDQVKQDYGVNSIIAARDGVIRDIIVTRGNALCKTGQAVKQGQVLVSGYTDCGIFIKAEPAEAEIFAQTLRNLDVVSPHYFAKRTNEMGVTKRYSVRIGKNIINFCKDSGISDAEYVKMYKEKILTLPGGFQLPVALIIEQNVRYDYVQMPAPADDGTAWLTQKADKYLRNQMIAGSILDSNVFVEQLDDVYHLSGNYSCLESIGQVRGEENIQNDG